MDDQVTRSDLPARPTTLPEPGLAFAPAGYELLDEIGRGGMGVVYRARDLRLDREVAIKLLQGAAAADSPAAGRFRAEARITGQLQHPGIPAVHELGTLPDGRPFLAMKLVQGSTLQHLLRPSSPSGERGVGGEGGIDRGRFVAIFEQICQAVGYAHAHGVIHRDLKPANIMVGAFGEVQVMDWGLAKRLATPARPESESEDDDLLSTAVFTPADTPQADGSATRTGAVMGTPAFMPPEQAGGEIRKLDARSDVFGLGAILCQILTGRPPYTGGNANDLRNKAVRCETAEALAALDGCGAEPALVALCKQCLLREQDQRPEDGAAVAATVAEIRQQAEARARQAEQERAEALVREGEQRKRRRVFQWAGGAVAAVLLLGIFGTSIGLFQADEARRAEQERANSEAAAKEAAQKRLAQIEKGVELFAGLLQGLNPRDEEQGAPPLYEQLRQRAAQVADELVDEAVGDPEATARLQTLLGNTLRGLGDAGKAVEVLERARATREVNLGADHPDTFATLNNLALAYLDAGKLAEALALFEQVRDAEVKKQGADHPSTLITLHNLAETYQVAGKLPEALALFEQVRDARVKNQGADHPETLITLNNLAVAYQSAGKLAEALALHEQVRNIRVRKLGAEHPDTLATLNNLAETCRDAGKLPEALALFEQVRDARVKKQGADHPETLTTLNNLALAYLDAGKLPEALALFEQVRDARVKKLGVDHPSTLNTSNNLAMAYRAAGKLPEALALLEQVRDAKVKKLGADHPDTFATLNNLALAYLDASKLPEALALFEQVRDAKVKKLGADHASTLTTLNNMASAYLDAGKLPEALALFEQVWHAEVKKLGADHPSTLITLNNLARVYRVAGKLTEALALHEQAAAGIERRQFQHEYTGRIIASTIAGYEQAKQLDRAEIWRRKWLAVVRDRAGADSAAYASELAGLGFNLFNQKKWTEAETILKECLALRDKIQPDAWWTFNIKSQLGAALLGQMKYAEAEPLLRTGYEGMKEREKTIPPKAQPRLIEALERLVQLYDAMGKKDEAAKWRQELEARKKAGGS